MPSIPCRDIYNEIVKKKKRLGLNELSRLYLQNYHTQLPGGSKLATRLQLGPEFASHRILDMFAEAYKNDVVLMPDGKLSAIGWEAPARKRRLAVTDDDDDDDVVFVETVTRPVKGRAALSSPVPVRVSVVTAPVAPNHPSMDDEFFHTTTRAEMMLFAPRLTEIYKTDREKYNRIMKRIHEIVDEACSCS